MLPRDLDTNKKDDLNSSAKFKTYFLAVTIAIIIALLLLATIKATLNKPCISKILITKYA